jgi:glycosyltransferase involved in cell wall biosynthesis
VHVQLEERQVGLQWAFKHPPELIITCARYLVEYVRQTLPEASRTRQPIVAVPNAVDTEAFGRTDKAFAKRRVGAPDGLPLILMLANLAPHKGQLTAIKTVAELKRRGIKTLCWLTGVERQGGEFTAKLRGLIAETAVSNNIHLLGYREDVAELLQAADFLLLPSTAEGLPLSILEAQAAKVPVLAAPTAGIPEIVKDGETGFLIAADDYLGYANRIQTLLNAPDMSHSVAEKAYDIVRTENSWRTFCQRVWDLYSELLTTR